MALKKGQGKTRLNIVNYQGPYLVFNPPWLTYIAMYWSTALEEQIKPLSLLIELGFYECRRYRLTVNVWVNHPNLGHRMHK